MAPSAFLTLHLQSNPIMLQSSKPQNWTLEEVKLMGKNTIFFDSDLARGKGFQLCAQHAPSNEKFEAFHAPLMLHLSDRPLCRAHCCLWSRVTAVQIRLSSAFTVPRSRAIPARWVLTFSNPTTRNISGQQSKFSSTSGYLHLFETIPKFLSAHSTVARMRVAPTVYTSQVRKIKAFDLSHES